MYILTRCHALLLYHQCSFRHNICSQSATFLEIPFSFPPFLLSYLTTLPNTSPTTLHRLNLRSRKRQPSEPHRQLIPIKVFSLLGLYRAQTPSAPAAEQFFPQSGRLLRGR